MAILSGVLVWEIPDRGAWWAAVPGVTESDMTEQLTFSLFMASEGLLGLTFLKRLSSSNPNDFANLSSLL